MTLQDDLLARLVADFDFTLRETADGIRLTAGRCPACGEPEAYTPPGNPFIVLCPRRNKCGVSTLTRALYPDAFQRFEEHHPATKEDPNATARAYLRSRGFDPAKMQGWWEQSATEDPDEMREWNKADRKGPRPRKYVTVRFTLSNGVDYHRFIDHAASAKNKITAPFQGHYWAPPQLDTWLATPGDLWITEGVLDACSLIAADRRAAACLSSKHVPSELLKRIADSTQRMTVVIAQDPDKAGRASAAVLAQACAERGIAYRFAFSPDGADWNDLLVRGELADGKRQAVFEDALWRGELHDSGSPAEYWETWKKKSRTPLFAYNGELWIARPGRTPEDGETPQRVSDFTAEALYRLRVRISSKVSNHFDVIEVTRRDGRVYPVMLSGAVIAKAAAFRQAVYTEAGGQWDGILPDLNMLLRQLRNRPVPEVTQVDAWGYDRESDCYFFPDAAYGKRGQRYAVGGAGFVRVQQHHYMPPAVGATEENVWLAPEPGLDVPDVLRRLHATHPHGYTLAALGFFTAAIFADQVAESLRMFPFLSMYGETHTGKSSLLEVLNRMLGRDWEGFPVSQSSSKAAFARHLAAYANLPVTLIEADQDTTFRWSEYVNLRTIYNRGAIRMVGVKTADNTVRVTPFHGALVFGWNDELLDDVKVKERMVSLQYVQRDNSAEKLEAINALGNIPFARLAGYHRAVIARRVEALALLMDMIPQYAEWFEAQGVEITRTAQNHAVPMAGLCMAVHLFLPDKEEGKQIIQHVANGLLRAALQKERELRDDPDDIKLFFDRLKAWISSPDGEGAKLHNYSPKDDEFAVNMREVEDLCAKGQVRFDRVSMLKALRRSPHLVRANHTFRRPSGETVKAWAFRRTAFD